MNTFRLSRLSPIQNFTFNDRAVRVQLIENKPYWCAKDVCDILGYSNGRKAVLDHCRIDGVTICDTILTDGRSMPMSYISEGNLYRLITKSTLPTAEKFESWVFEEVLPQIRKTGSYSLQVPKTLPEALRAYAAEVEAHEQSKRLLSEQQPKVDAWSQFIDADGLIEMNHVAQTCKTGRNRLYRRLREERIFFYDGAYNSVYQEYVNRGYFTVRFITNKEIGNIPIIKCTPKGADWIYNKFYRKVAA